MIAPLLRRAGAALLALLVLLVPLSPLVAINVQPVIIDLLSTGRRASGLVTLQNTFSETVPIEVTVHPVRVVNGQLQEMEDEEADDLLVFPAQAVVAPGASQAFRVQWVGDPAPATSMHYYVTVAQLPVALSGDQNAVQVLHRFRVLVNVGAPDTRASFQIVRTEIQTGEDGKPRPVLTVRNTGRNYGYVGQYRMAIVQRDAAGKEIFRQLYQPEQIQQAMGLGMVPSGETRILPIGVELPSKEGTVSIDLTTAAGA